MEKKYYAVLAIILQAVGIFIGAIIVIVIMIIKRLDRFAYIVFQLSPGSFALLTIYRVNFAISTVFVAVSVHCTATPSVKNIT